MKIQWAINPLETKVFLDLEDRGRLREKIKLDELYEIIIGASIAIEGGENYSVGRARKILNRIERNFENRIWKQTDMFEKGLQESHCGDCISAAASCPKCYAEEAIGINTIEGLTKAQGGYIDDAFRKHKNIYDVLESLKKHEPKIREGCEKYADTWKQNAKEAYEWLMNYYKTKLLFIP